MRDIANDALAELSGGFAALYAPLGRPSVPTEKLLRSSLLQAFYTIRSEHRLMERLDFDPLFRWFAGLGIDDEAWVHSVFSKNRDRLLEAEIAGKFLAAILTQPAVMRLLSSQHFSVDGTLVEAWASLKSLKPREAAVARRATGRRWTQRRSRLPRRRRTIQTHASTTDPMPCSTQRPGMEAKLCFIGHALMETAMGSRRRAADEGLRSCRTVAALNMIEARARPDAITLGSDKGFDAADFVMELREINVTPHIAQNATRRSAIDRRTTRHPG